MEINVCDVTKSGRIRKKTSKAIEMEEMEIYEIQEKFENKKRKSKVDSEKLSSKSFNQPTSPLVLKLPKPKGPVHTGAKSHLHETFNKNNETMMSSISITEYNADDDYDNNSMLIHDHIETNEYFDEEIEIGNDTKTPATLCNNFVDGDEEEEEEEGEEEDDDGDADEEIDIEDAFTTHTFLPNAQNYEKLCKIKLMKIKSVDQKYHTEESSDANIPSTVQPSASTSTTKISQQHQGQRSYYTAFKVWFLSQKQKVTAMNSELDRYHLVKLMKEMWQGVENEEKLKWRKKARKMSKSGELFEYSDDDFEILHGRHGRSRSKHAHSSTASSSSTTKHQRQQKSTLEPMDVAAHLRLLGESLTIIGNRLSEHKGTIAVQGSLSVLLDSLLCSLGSLMCLTNQVPQLNACPDELHRDTLDNIAYIMPGVG